MKTVISASRRTDIPAYYLNWFINCIRQGWVDVANPLYRKQIRRVDLTPNKVSWIIFWSRNYHSFLKSKTVFNDYQLLFHFTILSPSYMEKSSTLISKALKQADALAKYYGPDRIIWRYDPIVFWQKNGQIQHNFNQDEYTQICLELSEIGICRCYTSIAHPYLKYIQRFHQKFNDLVLPEVDTDLEKQILSRMAQIASGFGIELYACCTDRLLKIPGIKSGSCIDGKLLNLLYPAEKISVAASPTRSQCRCTASIDIGDYQAQPCPTGCIYCYANPLWK